MVDSGKRREATYQDVLDAPEHVVAEIIDGELYLSPRPAVPHARAVSTLQALLAPPFDFGDGGPGGWYFLVEPELHFGKQILVPDMAGWRRENLPKNLNVAFITDPPDWVCEGLSKSTVRLDREKKMPIYANAGVGHAWLVEPIMRTLEVYRRENRKFELVRMFIDDELIKAEPFDAIELRLDRIWALPSRAGERAVDYGR
jgi:Uma2 family endonuclease